MKTDLVDLVKATPVAKNFERQPFTPARGVNYGESSYNQQQSTQTFNQALKNRQNNHKETSYQAPTNTVKKANVSKEESNFTSLKEDNPQQKVNINEKDEDLNVEITEEETVELDTITLSTAVQAMQQEINNDSTITANNGGGESEAESKIDTLLSLLSKQTDVKIPKLEQYVSTMRDAGKSVQEMLNTLKSALEEVSEEENVDLKDFLLKIVYPKEMAEVFQKAELMPEEQSEEKPIPANGKEQKKIMNAQFENSAEKGQDLEGKENPVLEKKEQKMTSVNVVKETKTEQAPPVNNQEIIQLADQGENTTLEINNISDNDLLTPEVLQLLRDKVNAPMDQFNEGIFKSATQEVNLKEFPGSFNSTDLNTEIPEKLVEALSEKLNISKEDIVDFLNSNLIPKDKLQTFIQSFNTVDTQTFIQNNEALISQMKAFIKLYHHLDSGSKISLQSRSITVETTVIKQLILNRFNTNGFNSEFLNRKEPILFKSSQSEFTIEKLSVRFVSKTVHAETTDKGFFKNTDSDFLEKAVQTTKKFFQQTFKNGYETTSQRMTDLERFHAKANTTETQGEQLSNKAAKTISLDEKTTLNEKTIDTKFQTASTTEEKEVKGTKSSFDHETNNHSSELKAGRSFTDAFMKNEQTNQVRNLEQVYQKIKDMTQLMARQQTRTELATIKLNPPELGRVSLEVVKEGNKISILMQVETKEAQEILNKNSNLLAARLVNSGFELQKVTVQMEKYEEQGNNQSNENNEDNSQQQENENQDNNNEDEYGYEEEYTFADLLKGGIEENAG